ncbi:IS66 family insertion sequence element accessory protein TnpB [Methylobacterium longum]|uniref:IS66 family insertion sequence element accessory protein TnpB n=1 Tax=Methylobacterium longum TaxID=767694 RepID=A0ABT8AYM1_9HYPH|nr:IS66 family insertion sequence element accessory protein TnpB [Methylobacterium longum]MDN3574556.1 IS66 family insertion sequence element accessory protein TnpB [Methylobacterium longum]GJE09339.1 hypothetical protein FOHLNKBM_0362 [Methylobacterium longum]
MIPLPANVRVWLATGHTDMRKGFSSLGLIVQETLKRDPHGGHLFVLPQRRRGSTTSSDGGDRRSRSLHRRLRRVRHANCL